MDEKQEKLNKASAALDARLEELRVLYDKAHQFDMKAEERAEYERIIREVQSCAVELDRIKLGRT